MWKRALLAVAMMAAAPGAAAAQELVSYDSDSCRKIANPADTAANRELIYARAACVAARAGVSSPGALSQEELLSILMLMSLPKSPAAAHAS